MSPKFLRKIITVKAIKKLRIDDDEIDFTDKYIPTKKNRVEKKRINLETLSTDKFNFKKKAEN